MASALGVKDQVRALGRRRALAVLGVEIELIRRRALVGPIVDLHPVAAGLLTLVAERDAGRAGERHGDVAVARCARCRRVGQFPPPLVDAHQRGTDPFRETEADAEEITCRGLDTRFLLAVPVDAEYVELQVMRLTAGDIVAEVDDAARSLDLGQHAGLAGPDVPPVGVAARGISGGDAMRLEVPQCGQVVECGSWPNKDAESTRTIGTQRLGFMAGYGPGDGTERSRLNVPSVASQRAVG